jgi:hypothetical protein
VLSPVRSLLRPPMGRGAIPAGYDGVIDGRGQPIADGRSQLLIVKNGAWS